MAVTTTTAVPWPTPATMRVAPVTETVTTSVLNEIAEYARSSPSGSLKYAASAISNDPPTKVSASGTCPTATGARFGTVTEKV